MAEDEAIIYVDDSCLDNIKNPKILMKIQGAEGRNYWHKFIIENGAFLDKEEVLFSILHFIHPIYIVPVKYDIEGNNSYFLARNSDEVIIKLCQESLKVPYNSGQKSSGSEKAVLRLAIEIFHKKQEDFPLSMKITLEKALGKRLKISEKEEVDLSNFHNDPELNEIFCPLSIHKNLYYVSTQISKFLEGSTKEKKINLSSNHLKNLDFVEVIKALKNLTSLDLSNNEIDSTSKLTIIGRSLTSLQEIDLNGNPLCSFYTSKTKYIKAVLTVLPSIKKLDGIVIDVGLPICRTWLCNSECENLVNQFVEHYFTLYDSNRVLLKPIYHQSALFSIMCNQAEEPSPNLKLECYQSASRNLLERHNLNSFSQIYINREEIMRFLECLPQTEHDFGSFKVDLMHHKDEMSVLMVSGVFRDFLEESRYRSFNRTFVLYQIAQSKFKIINELYQVTQASKDEIENSFLHSRTSSNFMGGKIQNFVGTVEECQNMVQFISKFTNMNETFSKKWLEDANWNLKKALEVFIDQYKNLKIPPEAFRD